MKVIQSQDIFASSPEWIRTDIFKDKNSNNVNRSFYDKYAKSPNLKDRGNQGILKDKRQVSHSKQKVITNAIINILEWWRKKNTKWWK